MKKYTLTLDEVEKFSDEIVDAFKNGVIILRGDLAAGKTTLTKYIVASLGVDDEVTSPTFSLQQCYSDKVYHYDIYNKGLEHFISMGMLEELEKNGLHIVEWGDDKLRDILVDVGFKVLEIDIKKIDANKREYILREYE
ncbi:tRNA (adenosine(37)-N6)-threonylcarbamoyltransferase complex ATPase subunit type 1 TsaE [Sulfurimonas lithotrophica]|uniref:tRNA threonylcarbamoyladenosine biosynthesis protein TsaE n=1 Tax=Sulfurimonas lithotrophica TaxID=2590022 RepID=A0A5P8P0V5_9BACT|nr:tRNA (adenosine(37)-N6)-threonylcarbamoyltransferase complex ATPase subunit type 1 TsaE [Sulfurimonas lithotrophica]QFR49345.1 tRNA (adenosine(37)-N6)-threonylcarbamoyltransferase complex ATPase subunit type 1 TsaE [Sulfurimonas lithotrophica]